VSSEAWKETPLDDGELEDIEARAAAVLMACANGTPQVGALSAATALYALIWADVRAQDVPEQDERRTIDALLTLAIEQGREYARAMIAEGQFMVVVP
jgi:hypothetical protein